MVADGKELSRPEGSKNEQLFNRMLEKHLDEIRAFVRIRAGRLLRARETESDIVQSACREVLIDLPERSLEDESEVRRWLFTAAMRKIIDRARYHEADKRDARREVIEGRTEALAACYDSIAGPSHQARSNEACQRIEEAFDRISEDEREVILLSRIAKLSHEEIAAHMGRTVLATRSLLSRALARIAVLLDQQD